MPPPTLQAGKLRHKINILAPTLAQDSFGGTKISDQTVLYPRLSASVEVLSGRELEAARTIVAQVTHRVTIRWQSGIRAWHNVEWPQDGGAEYDRYFQIQDIPGDPEGKRHLLVLLCLEREDWARELGAAAL